MGEGESGMIWENSIETCILHLILAKRLKSDMYIIKCERDHQPRLDAWDKCSGLVHWEDPEGWDGEGGGRVVQNGEHM